MPPLFTDLPPFHAPPPRPRPACTPPRALWSPPLKRPSPRGLVGHDAVDYDGPVQMNYEFLNDLHAKLSNSKRVQLLHVSTRLPNSQVWFLQSVNL
jgi:hypothetical protein